MKPRWESILLSGLMSGLLLVGELFAQGESPARLPEPAAEQVAGGRAKLKKTMKTQFAAAKKAPEKAALAESLIEIAASESDPATQYALLTESRELALAALDWQLAARCIGELGQRFEIDGPQVRFDALKRLGSADKKGAVLSTRIDAWIQLAQEAAAADRYELALEAAEEGGTAANKSKDRLLIADLSDQRRELQQASKDFTAAQNAETELEKSPDDANASQVLGTYLCQSKQDWERGLKLLAKSRGKLQELAAEDVAAPKTASAQVQLAEGWLAFAKADRANAAFAIRAIHWFTAAQEAATGTVKSRCAAGLKEAGEVRDETTPLGFLLARIRPGLQNGKVTRTALVTCDFQKDPPEAYSVLPPQGAVLIGFNLTVGAYYQFKVIKSAQPVFATGSETILGEVAGQPAGTLVEIRPRPGYVVSGLSIKPGNRIAEFAVQYSRVKNGKLDPQHSYWTDYYGGSTMDKPRTVLSNGKPVVGVFGQIGRLNGEGAPDVFSLGLVVTP